MTIDELDAILNQGPVLPDRVAKAAQHTRLIIDRLYDQMPDAEHKLIYLASVRQHLNGLVAVNLNALAAPEGSL